MHRIVVLALDGVLPFELSILGAIFGAATDAGGAALYDVVTCTLDGAPVATNADFRVTVDHGPDALATADTLVIPASHGETARACEEGRLPPAVAAAFGRLRPEARLVSICTAAFVLAAAGRLDGT